MTKKYTELSQEYLKLHYVDLKKSPPEIAEQLGTYPNKVRRALVKLGFTLRDRSEAQSIAIESGRTVHPTAGKKQDKVTKDKIAASLSKSLANLSDEEKEKRSKNASNKWKKKSFKKQKEFLDAAFEGVRRASKEGSKFELLLRDKLIGAGYVIEWHKENLFDDAKMHVDIFVPKIKTVIEIDGPAHFKPIWGEENLKKHQAKDKKKNGIIIGAKLNMLRVKNLHRSISNYKMEQGAKKVLEALEQIKNTLTINGQYVEVEI